MKRILIALLLISGCFQSYSQVKNIYESPKGFSKKIEKIAIVGAGVRIKNSTRFYDTQGKGGKTWVRLEGLSEAGKQALADWFYEELAKRYQAIGYPVLDPAEYKSNDQYLKMSEPGQKRVYNNNVFGEATVYSSKGLGFFDYPKSVLGAQFKLSKQLTATLANHVITLDFAYVDQEAGLVKNEYYSGVDKIIVTESSSQVFPILSISAKSPGASLSNLSNMDLYANWASLVFEQHGSNFMTTEDFRSDLDFVVDVQNRNESGIFFFTLTTTDELYLNAAKNVISNYLDQLFGNLNK